MSSISLLSPPLSPSRRPYVTGFRGQQIVGKVGQLAPGFAQTGPSGHARTGHASQSTLLGAMPPRRLPAPPAVGIGVEPSPGPVKPSPNVDYLVPSLLDLDTYKTSPFPLCPAHESPSFTSTIASELCSMADSPSPPLHCPSPISCHLPVDIS